MNINKFTQNSLQAVQNCEKIAADNGNQELAQEHLLYALLTQDDSLILKLFEKMDRRSDDCSGEDHCDPVCTSGSDHTWNFRIYEKEGLDSPGRHETGAVGRKWITEIGKILLQ